MIDSENLFHVIDNMYDEILIYDNNYKIVYINKACSRHYGCSPEQMIGKSFYDFINIDWWGPSILPVIYKEKKAHAIKQKTYIGSELLTIAVPIFDENNDIKYVAMNVRDIVQDADLYNPHYIYEKQDKSAFQFIYESDEMKTVMSLIDKVAGLNVTCIITGESGTGKTMVAKYMHTTANPNKPFVSINCASIPPDLIETELFGYAKGAFTGANIEGKKGLFESANTGTILLDEVSELSMPAQAKLLHVLQDKEFIPVGGRMSVKVDVRIIAATNKNLKTMVENGQFREDLYYRLNVVDIYIPPLRKRKDDVIPLIYFFTNYFCKKYNITRQFSNSAIHVLASYDWPGNVRELSHIIERLLITSDTLMVDSTVLPKHLFGIIDSVPEIPINGNFEEKVAKYEEYLVKDAYNKFKSSRKVAEHLVISQTKANNLIKKYIRN